MESRMKTLCSALLECMILPLQDKLEEWRKNVGILDKEHNKEYKKVIITKKVLTFVDFTSFYSYSDYEKH